MGPEDVATDPAKVEAVRNWPIPRNVSEVLSFLGLGSYYRRFIRNFASTATPLHRLTDKGRMFSWADDCVAAFAQLRAALTTAPFLALPDPGRSLIVDMDASDVGLGAVLSQEGAGGERVQAYYRFTT